MGIALVNVVHSWIEGTELSQKLLQTLEQQVEVVESTTLYKRIITDANGEVSPFDCTIEFIISISTEMTAKDLGQKLRSIFAKTEKKREDSIFCFYLLLYDQIVVMTPDLTLPNPRLQYDDLTLRLSSEIWARYEHPVLKRTLGELAESRRADIPAEFVMQGNKLFDFPKEST